jgi:hypothetical protein
MFDLPPKRSFEPPHYPNAWFYVSERIAPTYADAMAFVRTALVRYVGVADSLKPTTNLECADLQRRAHHLQLVSGLSHPSLDHYHDLHIRYFFRHLPRRAQHHTTVAVDGQTYRCWRLPTSVHYEPEAEHPGHPYIDECPVCGVFSPYNLEGDRCDLCHEPLGLELLFFGRVRGEVIYRADGLPVGGVQDMAAHFNLRLTTMEPWALDMNTYRIGIAMILSRRADEQPPNQFWLA